MIVLHRYTAAMASSDDSLVPFDVEVTSTQPSPQTVQVDVRTLTGQTLSWSLDRFTPILDIMERVQAAVGIPFGAFTLEYRRALLLNPSLDQMRLIHNYRQLTDDMYLYQCDPRDRIVIQLVIRLRGGDFGRAVVIALWTWDGVITSMVRVSNRLLCLLLHFFRDTGWPSAENVNQRGRTVLC